MFWGGSRSPSGSVVHCLSVRRGPPTAWPHLNLQIGALVSRLRNPPPPRVQSPPSNCVWRRRCGRYRNWHSKSKHRSDSCGLRAVRVLARWGRPSGACKFAVGSRVGPATAHQNQLPPSALGYASGMRKDPTKSPFLWVMAGVQGRSIRSRSLNSSQVSIAPSPHRN